MATTTTSADRISAVIKLIEDEYFGDNLEVSSFGFIAWVWDAAGHNRQISARHDVDGHLVSAHIDGQRTSLKQVEALAANLGDRMGA